MSATDANAELELPEDVEALKAHIAHLTTQLAARDAEVAAHETEHAFRLRFGEPDDPELR